MTDLNLTEVEIIPVKPRQGLVAFASCVVDGWLYIANIAIHTRPDGSGYRLVFPVKVLPNGKTIHCFHPVSQEAGHLLNEAIIEKFEALTASAQRGEDVSETLRRRGGFNANGPAVS